jgi:hypothetical protein
MSLIIDRPRSPFYRADRCILTESVDSINGYFLAVSLDLHRQSVLVAPRLIKIAQQGVAEDGAGSRFNPP